MSKQLQRISRAYLNKDMRAKFRIFNPRKKIEFLSKHERSTEDFLQEVFAIFQQTFTNQLSVRQKIQKFPCKDLVKKFITFQKQTFGKRKNLHKTNGTFSKVYEVINRENKNRRKASTEAS